MPGYSSGSAGGELLPADAPAPPLFQSTPGPVKTATASPAPPIVKGTPQHTPKGHEEATKRKRAEEDDEPSSKRLASRWEEETRKQHEEFIARLEQERSQQISMMQQDLAAMRKQFQEERAKQQEQDEERRARQKHRHAEMEAQHQAALNEQLEQQKKKWEQERAHHQEELARLHEQVSAQQALQMASPVPAGPLSVLDTHEPSQVLTKQASKDQLKAKIAQHTMPATPIAVHPAPSPVTSNATSAPTTPSQTAIIPVGGSEGSATVAKAAVFNSSTHPAAWSCLNRIAKLPDCDPKIAEAWHAGRKCRQP